MKKEDLFNLFLLSNTGPDFHLIHGINFFFCAMCAAENSFLCATCAAERDFCASPSWKEHSISSSICHVNTRFCVSPTEPAGPSTCSRVVARSYAFLWPDVYLGRDVILASGSGVHFNRGRRQPGRASGAGGSEVAPWLGLPFPRVRDIVTFHKEPFQSGGNRWRATKLLAVRSPADHSTGQGFVEEVFVSCKMRLDCGKCRPLWFLGFWVFGLLAFSAVPRLWGNTQSTCFFFTCCNLFPLCQQKLFYCYCIIFCAFFHILQFFSGASELSILFHFLLRHPPYISAETAAQNS